MYGLSNEQLVFIYLHLELVKRRYETVFDSRVLSQNVLGPDSGVVAHALLGDEIIKELRESEHFKTLTETLDKLEPIYDLIMDVEPDMVKRIAALFDV